MAELKDHTRDRRNAWRLPYGGEAGLIFGALATAPKPALQQQYKTTLYPQNGRYRDQPGL